MSFDKLTLFIYKIGPGDFFYICLVLPKMPTINRLIIIFIIIYLLLLYFFILAYQVIADLSFGRVCVCVCVSVGACEWLYKCIEL